MIMIGVHGFFEIETAVEAAAPAAGLIMAAIMLLSLFVQVLRFESVHFVPRQGFEP
jgi:hypothetical protein